MFRRFITGLIGAATLAATVTAQPARADTDDLARFLGAATGLFLLGTIIDGAAQADHAPPRVTRKVVPPRRSHPATRTVPARCLRDSRVDGTRFVVGRGCLKRSGIAPTALPRACAVRTPVAGGVQRGFALRCLRGRGYRIAGH